jgi:hypothetical protein
MARKLPSTINRRSIQTRIASAWRTKGGTRAANVVYDHGKWWIQVPFTGAEYSVVDASGPGSVDGFDFEEITPPSER